MKQIYSEKIGKILKNRRELEKELEVKITNYGSDILVSGKAEDEFIAEKVIDAINFGFDIKIALLIKEEELMLEILSIKSYTTRKDLPRIRARLIGLKGKTLKTLCQLTNCFFVVNEKHNQVGIIGRPEFLENSQTAVASIIKGTKQANAYKYLEKHQHKEVVDLGLKEWKKKKE